MENKLVNIEKLKLKYHHHKDLVAQNLIGMGNTLIELKDNMEHGQWMDFIKNESEISISTAQKYMKVAKELGTKAELVTNLGIKKAYKLLSVPVDERDEFIESNNIKGLSYSNLCKLIDDTKAEPVPHLDMDKKIEKVFSNTPVPELEDLSGAELTSKIISLTKDLKEGMLRMDISIIKAKINNWELQEDVHESYEVFNYLFGSERAYSLDELEDILSKDDTSRLYKLIQTALN